MAKEDVFENVRVIDADQLAQMFPRGPAICASPSYKADPSRRNTEARRALDVITEVPKRS